MATEKPITVLGVDSTKGGWVAARAQAGQFVSLHHNSDISKLVAGHPDAATIAIDIPLWFPTGRQPRTSDPAARKLLGPRRSSVFAVPHREVLEAPSFAEANTLSKELCDRGITQQSFALRAKILEAVSFMESTGENRLCEVHPELSFHFLAKRLRLEITASKKTWSGFTKRLSLLQAVGMAPPLGAREDLGLTAPDDVLDACVGAWSAHRIATGGAELVGADLDSTPPEQLSGHPQVIYA